ncbi:hypothetical protein PRIC1_003789 [Phytophthora ramorum]|uniref:uncharacterized protein n=1 Tax=Phytophthora ramorum TaxID=164328 RepID=UPI00309B628A|nr:hypothetical protein KRP23_3542 [Phytophthora ramorum]KAH7508130.1 hypothetical protein KRP22_3221 [Phytophthora ramorum]
MHRTRHSSLDYLSGGAASQEEWSEFLSTSMMALSTADADVDADASLGSVSPTRRSHHDIGIGRRQAKPRGMSMNEATSSPPTDAWRPLGRRVASPPPTLARSSSSSGSPSPPSSDNQNEHFRAVDAHVTVMSTFGRLGSSGESKLKHAASFRGVVSSCLSSSGSSFYDSSSDDEQQQETGSPSNQVEAGVVPAPPPVDPSYAEACLPVLSQLPRPPRSISVDSGSGARAASLAHVKSPVLGNRKDAQTWQLQDEEFLMTSPRFGSSLNREGTGAHVDLFRGNSVGSLLSTEVNNQFDDEYQGHPRLTKDSRASSVDFTLGRSHEVNPPLPPPQEPLQRLRARSFSYSPAYGAPGYNPFGNKQYGPPPHHQQQLQQQQAMGQEFTLRSFHAGNGMMQSGQPQPPLTGVRPPRVSIPTDSPMHQYQYGPPMPYRRYSDAFAMPPYPDSYNGEQQENQSRQSNSGRGMRSYSVEYGNYPSTRQVRSQSMEGSQLFASAPPMEYPPSLSRSNSAGVGFDWSRGRMDAAPPLPPDVRPSNNNGTSHYPPPPPEAYYDVEFKRGRQEVFAGRAVYKPGEYVKVEADRGEDIGRIVQRTTDMSKFGGGHDSGSPGEEAMGRSKRHDLPTKKIICVASQRECDMLSEQRKEEHEVFEVCKSKVRQRLLPMNVIDAEYQFDRHKLTFFFEADRRIDFRELVRDLFAIYKTRIWLQQVVPSGKKAGIDSDAN